ncbi:Transcriptional regulator, contains HTH domain [Halalkaliarchaeum sp. AArc-CO]|uniref:helix-turn-helix domain-containing protein n=1 Tax=unclassified Halalkaliarchaeum TaxID=2678344 RepID=UPI00217D1532|nr:MULTISPECIES: helix-turn-helix domain-containing protein [unclassified Halalkaliarchaeum]MDR5673045.1 helix-turn-helix domain-containing protein [Halalkaliarchaeum sp. AArc-GB]UWG49524.1 Transcriptional regulator, contains HTH domain [Halalkaliarchaeum sp. AArc-CO]
MSTDSDVDATLSPGEIDFQHVLSCVFGIQDHESRTYLVLRSNPGSTVSELADALERDRSNVNRSLTALMEKGFVERQRRLLDSGGYIYQYTAIPLPEARALLHETLEEWVKKVHDRIDEFGTEGRP